MRRAFAICVLFTSALSALETGKRYDFICSNGEDILNAELITEDAERYYLRLTSSAPKVPLEKKYVTSIVPKIQNPPPVPVNLRINFLLGAALATGRLAGFSTAAPALSIGASMAGFGSTEWVARGDLQQFSKNGDYLRASLMTAGLQIPVLHIGEKLKVCAGVSAGIAHVFTSSAGEQSGGIVPAASIWSEMNRPMTGTWSLTLRVQALYIYDAQTFVLTPGFLAGAAYGF